MAGGSIPNPVNGQALVAAKAAAAAGFGGDLLITMVAIAGAESGWNPGAHNPVPPDDSYGLWQINMLGGMGPERRRLFGISSNSQLFDPATNARAAMIIYKQQGLRAWSTYSHGSYKRHLITARYAVQAIGAPGMPGLPIPDIPNPIGPVVDTAQAVAGFLGALSDPNVWIRVAQGLLGVGLVVAGTIKLAQPAAGPALQLAQLATPVGRAAGAAGGALKAAGRTAAAGAA